MCGRYSFSTDKDQLRKQFGDIQVGETLRINFNVAPTQESYVLVDREPDVLQTFRWGLIPFWAKDARIGSRMINARSETLLEKPAFRQAARKRHCLVLADSFYEWKRRGKEKIPYRILARDHHSLLVMAGIWEHWSQGEQDIYSFSIITCPPNEEMVPVHDRMPVIFPHRDQWEAWLEEKDPAAVRELLDTPQSGILDMYAVSTRVNSVRNNGPELHEPVGEQGDLF